MCSVELECRSAHPGTGEWVEGLINELAKQVFVIDDAVIELSSATPTSGGASTGKEVSGRHVRVKRPVKAPSENYIMTKTGGWQSYLKFC